MPRAAIIGTGFYVPPTVVTNDDLARMMDTSDEWITERSGIKERRWLDIGPDNLTVETGTDMAVKAAEQALTASGIDRGEIDLVIFATMNPDLTFPGNGVHIEDRMALKTAGAMDIRNQCTGFIYGLAAADSFIQADNARTVLLIGCEIHSTAMDKTTRGRDLAVLFGDGAGAVIVQASDEPNRGVLASVLHSQGRFARDLCVEAPIANMPERIDAEMMAAGRHFPHMNGAMVFKHATRRFCEAIGEVLAKGGYEADDVSLLIPHQANQRITDAVGARMGFGPERVMSNIARYGNTTAASIPIAMAEAVSEGRIGRGDLIVTVAFGSGFTWGANLIRW